MSEKSLQASHSGDSNVDDDRFVCKPLDSLQEVAEFLKNPPAWRSLCMELKPHSEYAVRNMDIVRQNHPEENYEVQIEYPETFCHFDPDLEEVGRHKRVDLPQTLVCHDMANGYHDDSKLNGTTNYDAYTFYNWAVVDIFCYFSHRFITVPPLGWINAGHAHGVKVIGTVITEWTDGSAIWEKLLADPAEWQGFAAMLVAVAKTLKFDGWLLNIENKISQPAALVEFVQHLHGLLRRELAAAELVWYDSVTDTGALHWQNTLNEHNKVFFNASDSLFTNYSWSPSDVARGAATAAAAARRHAMLVGVDVWGRNFIGGGQLNTQYAVKIAYRNDCSLAVFAPAWTHEAMPDGPGGASGRLQRFLVRERALWGSLWPFLAIKLPSTLPFTTSFCHGQGPVRRKYGEVVSPGPWYNLRHQQYQPNAAHGPHSYRLASASTPDKPTLRQRLKQLLRKKIKKKDSEDPQSSYPRYTVVHQEGTECIDVHYDDSFNGGSCLAVESSEGLVRLFHCDFEIEEELIVCVVTKPLPRRPGRSLDVIVTLVDGEGSTSRRVLSGALRSPADAAFRELQRYLLTHEPGFYVSVENAYGWDVRYYSVREAGGRVVGVACAGAALLGLLGLCHRREDKE